MGICTEYVLVAPSLKTHAIRSPELVSQGNVLIDDDGNARLTDFGMALVSEATSYGYASAHGSGAIRWTAPELIDPEEFEMEDSRPTPASDIFSFACMAVEVSIRSADLMRTIC